MYSILLSPYERKFYDEFKLNPARYEHNIVTAHNILSEGLDIKRLENSLHCVVKSYVLLGSKIFEDSNRVAYWYPNNQYKGIEYYQNLSEEEILLNVKRPFNLNTGPLYRFIVIKENCQRYKFIVILHHIIVKDDSVHFFYNELTNFYNNPGYKSILPIEEQIKNHTYFSEECTKYINSSRELSENFWKESLAKIEIVDLTFLKYNKNRNENSDTQPSRVLKENFQFCKETLKKIYTIKQIYGVSPFILSQIVYAMLVYRHTNQSNFGVCYPIAIKNAHKLVFGGNININIIPYDFTKATNIVDVISDTKLFINSLKNTINPGLLPIINIIDATNPKILNVAFAQSTLETIPLNLEDATTQIITDYCIDLTNDLIFEHGIVDEEPHYRVYYSSDKISKKFLQSFIERYKNTFYKIIDELLEERVINRLTNINNYSLLSREEYIDMVYSWNNTKVDYDNISSSLPVMFEEQCIRSPNALSLVYKDKKYTYRELNIVSNQLANFLKREYGIYPNTLVLLYFDRCDDLIISLLAILKAEGAYVPIDPDYPDERVMYIIRDTKAKVILTNNKNNFKLEEIINRQDKCKEFIDIKIVVVDPYEFISELPEDNNNPDNRSLQSTDLAYVIYTSGTTGVPKGVMVQHQGLINFSNDLVERYLIGIENNVEVIALFSNYVFDASVEQILLPLLNGHTLLVLPNLMWLEESTFFKYLNDNRVTHIHSTPSFLKQLDFTKVPTLKRLIFGGEALTEESFLKIKCSKGCDIITEYGLVETSVTSSVGFVKNALQTMTLGMPISNTKFYILDKLLQPLPINTIGEIFIGGVGIAQGYLNNNQLTDERFIEDPFDHSERLYRTGDLGRYLEDGNIEFIGRNDHQVKILGYRIELHEIEKVLSAFEGVRQSVVIAKTMQSNTQEQCLVGYYVAEKQLDEEVIFEHMFSYLPAYMVPKSLIYLDSLPLTFNGKIDIHLLREVSSSNHYQIPTDPTAVKLAEIWSIVLKNKKIGIYDNFFFLGGSSLTAMRATVLAQEYNINLEFHELYHSQNLISLARLIDAKLTKQSYDTNITTIDTNPSISLFQQEKWFLYLEDPNSFNVPVIVTLRGNLDKIALNSAYNSVFRKHDILRTFYTVDSTMQGFQNILKHRTLKLTTIKLKRIDDQEELIQDHITKFIERRFCIQNNPTLRAVLIEVTNNYHILVFVFNHFGFDSISFDILVKELCEIYNTYPAVSKKISKVNGQYSIFAMQQKERLENKIYEIDKAKFKELFNFKMSEIRFPMRSNNRNMNNIFVQQDILFPLDQLSKYRMQYIPFALSIYFCVLFNITDTKEISIPYLMTVRPSYLDINTIGCFTHTYPVNIALTNNDYSFQNILSQVSKQLMLIREVQNIPFNYLANKLDFIPSVIPNNLIFIVQNMNDEPFNLKNIEIGQMEYKNHSMKEDVSCELFETSQSLKLRFTFRNEIYSSSIEKILYSLYDFINLVIRDRTINVFYLKEIMNSDNQTKQ